MKNLLSLRSILTVPEACKYLSTLDITATETDIYDLVLDCKLKLSIDFPEGVWVRNEKNRKNERLIGVFDLAMNASEISAVEEEREKTGGVKAHNLSDLLQGHVELERDGISYIFLYDFKNPANDPDYQTNLDMPPFLAGEYQFVIKKEELDSFIAKHLNKTMPSENTNEIEKLKARIVDLEQQNQKLQKSLKGFSENPTGRNLVSYRRLVAGMAIDKYHIPVHIDDTTGKTIPKFDGISNIVNTLDKLKKARTLDGSVSENTVRSILRDAFEEVVSGDKIKMG